jgi:hypothetical protein
MVLIRIANTFVYQGKKFRPYLTIRHGDLGETKKRSGSQEGQTGN